MKDKASMRALFPMLTEHISDDDPRIIGSPVNIEIPNHQTDKTSFGVRNKIADRSSQKSTLSPHNHSQTDKY